MADDVIITPFFQYYYTESVILQGQWDGRQRTSPLTIRRRREFGIGAATLSRSGRGLLNSPLPGERTT